MFAVFGERLWSNSFAIIARADFVASLWCEMRIRIDVNVGFLIDAPAGPRQSHKSKARARSIFNEPPTKIAVITGCASESHSACMTNAISGRR